MSIAAIEGISIDSVNSASERIQAIIDEVSLPVWAVSQIQKTFDYIYLIFAICFRCLLCSHRLIFTCFLVFVTDS